MTNATKGRVKMRLVLMTIFAGFAMMGCGKSEQVESAAPATKIEAPAAKTVDISRYVGKHPTELMSEPQISANLDRILGSNAKRFFDNIDVSAGLEDRGDYYFGAGCAPHNCSVYESAFAVNKKDLSVYAAVLEGGDKLSYFGASSAKNLPLPLSEWYRDNGGNEGITEQSPPSKQTAPQTNSINSPSEERSGAPGKWVFGYEYKYFGDGSCKDKDTEVCISFEQYQQACTAAKGVTKGATGLFKLTASAEEKALIEGGSLIADDIFFGKTHCYAKLTYSGIYKGTSTRVQISGKATTFIKAKDGELLVSFVDPV